MKDLDIWLYIGALIVVLAGMVTVAVLIVLGVI